MRNKVQIIDTDSEFGEQLREAFEALGWDAEATTDGSEGVDLANLDPPALIVLGMMDTKGAGYGLCSKLRRRAPDVPVIMVIDAAEEDSERLDRHRALKTSADTYLTRPFTLAALAAQVNALVSRSAQVPAGDESQMLGEALGGEVSDVLLGSSVFDEQELRELELEADQAFSSIVLDADMGDAGSIIDEMPVLSLDGSEVLETGSEAQLGGLPVLADDLLSVETDLLEDALEGPTRHFGDSPFEDQITTSARLNMLAPPASDKALREAEHLAQEAAQFERDNRTLRQRVTELQQELLLAREALGKRDAEQQSVRSSDSVARRELLEVREDLNRREREVLELRDRLTARDRQMMDVGDQLDQARGDHERAQADLRAAEARATAAQSAREETEREIESLRVRLSETRVRLEKAREETEKTYEEVKSAQKKATTDLQAARDAAGQALAETEERLTLQLADAEARAARASHDAESTRQRAEREASEAAATGGGERPLGRERGASPGGPLAEGGRSERDDPRRPWGRLGVGRW